LRKVALFLPAKVSSKLSFSGKTCLTDGSQLEANPDCALPWFHALISWNGDVGICAQHPKLGNLREQSFEEIYAGARCSGPPWTPVRLSPQCSRRPRPGGDRAGAVGQR
jgi:MoaA/NifB/PqqE/SkfB family radical SAM enzyme